MKKIMRIISVSLCLMLALSVSASFTKAAASEIQTEDSVARVGDEYYDTLAEAFNAIQTEGTVELVADATMDKNIIIAAGKTVTLDLGTYTITPSESFEFGMYMLFINRGTFTIKGEGTIDATGKTNLYYAIDNAGGKLYVNSGKIIGRNEGIRTRKYGMNNGILTISGGEISNVVSYKDDCAIYAYESTVEISGNAQIHGLNAAVRAYGSTVTISGNASLSGAFGVMLFNDISENTPTAKHSSLTMTGGTISATNGFALSGNNMQSALCSAEITGGTLTSIDEATGIYWPMEGALTIGGNAVVRGGTGIEAKMGTITVKDNATIIGTGAWLEDEPYGGGSQAEGSAILTSAQMYGANAGQYITSPDLTVNITGGTLTGTLGNAVTVYNTENTDAQKVNVAVTGGSLEAAEERAGVKVIMASGENQHELTQDADVNSFVTSQSNTTVTVSENAALAVVNQGGNASYYRNINDALKANTGDVESIVNIYVLGNSEVDSEALENENVVLTTAKGVELHITSNVEGKIVQETTNDDGSKTYVLVDASTFAAPQVTLKADATTVHVGEEITLTATATHEEKDVTYTYAWYKDGNLIAGEEKDTLKVTESGVYTVKVVAHKADGNVVLNSEEIESKGVSCTIEPHKYEGDWKYDETNHWQECKCGEKGNVAAHTYEWVVDKEATETEAGLKHEECTICGHAKAAVEIPATGTTNKPADEKPSVDTETPNTSDNSNIILWISLMLVAGGALALAFVYRSKKRYSK